MEASMKPEDVRKIGVVGCGIMGSGIVEVCAKAGFEVVVVELNEEAMARGRSRVEGSMAKAVERGKIEAGKRDEALARISDSTSLDDLTDADLGIEAATESLQTKPGVFAPLDR